MPPALPRLVLSLVLLSLLLSPVARGQDASPPTNAAELYKQAFQSLAAKPIEGQPPPLFQGEEFNLIADVLSPEDITPQVRELLRKAAPVLDLARQGAGLERCDFGLDRSQGFAMLLPHLGPMRSLSRLLRADAMARLADGDVAGAVDGFGALAGLSRHSAGDDVLISSLVGMAIAGVTDASIQAAIDRGQIDQAHAARLLEKMAPLAGSDPFRCADALSSEIEMIDGTVRQALESPEGTAELAEFLGGDGEALAGASREELLEQVAMCEQLIDRCAEAFREPDPERAMATLEEVESAVADGAAGALGQMLMPSLRAVYESKRRSEAALASQFAQLRDLASGARTPSDLANAAMSYLAAARAAQRITAEDQRLIEAARATAGGVDDLFVAMMSKAIERHRAAVVEPILAGSRAGRCEFVRDRPRTVGVVALPHYSAGLRAAARTVLASALLNARTAAVPATPQATKVAAAEQATVEFLAVLRLVDLVSRDAAMAHSVIAQSVLDETREALAAAWAGGGLDEAQRARIRTAVERLDRVDPLGHRRALVADRAALLARLPGFRNDELRKVRRKAIDALDGATLLACGLAMQARDAATGGRLPGMPAPADGAAAVAFDCGGRDEDLLLDLADLYVQDSCQAIVQRATELLSAPLFSATEVEALEGSTTIPGDPLPLLVDVNRLSAEATSVIGAADSAVREKQTAPK